MALKYCALLSCRSHSYRSPIRNSISAISSPGMGVESPPASASTLRLPNTNNVFASVGMRIRRIWASPAEVLPSGTKPSTTPLAS